METSCLWLLQAIAWRAQACGKGTICEMRLRRDQALCLLDCVLPVSLLSSWHEGVLLKVFYYWVIKAIGYLFLYVERITLILLTALLARDENCWMSEYIYSVYHLMDSIILRECKKFTRHPWILNFALIWILHLFERHLKSKLGRCFPPEKAWEEELF